MPPHLNSATLASSRTRANLILYGTIGLCATASFANLHHTTNVTRAVRANDEPAYVRAATRYLAFQQHFVCSRDNLRRGRYYTLVTAAWNHGDVVHLLGNVLGLWSFGRVIASAFGAGTFVTVFYGGAVVGNLFCLGLDSRVVGKVVKTIQGKENMVGDNGEEKRPAGFIGASGGVCALTAANACLNPWGSMILGIMFIPVPVPNVFGALGFAGFSAWAQTNEFQLGVAHLGHLGGLFHGFLWFVARFRGLPLLSV